jgi:hypothetical protein
MSFAFRTGVVEESATLAVDGEQVVNLPDGSKVGGVMAINDSDGKVFPILAVGDDTDLGFTAIVDEDEGTVTFKNETGAEVDTATVRVIVVM